MKTTGMRTDCHFHGPFETSSKRSHRSSLQNLRGKNATSKMNVQSGENVVADLTWDSLNRFVGRVRIVIVKTNAFSVMVIMMRQPQGNSTKFYNVHLLCNIAYFVLFIALVLTSLNDYWRSYFLLFEASHWGNSSIFFSVGIVMSFISKENYKVDIFCQTASPKRK